MNSIIELSQVSSFRPTTGHLLELFEILENSSSRTDAQKQWKILGRSRDSFRQALKKLKDSLLEEAKFEKEDFSAAQNKRIECWNKFFKINSLLIAEKKYAAVAIATETLKLSQRCGLTEIEASLSHLLESHYGSIKLDTRKYLRYRKLRKTSANKLSEEREIQSLYTKLVFYYFRKKDLSELDDGIKWAESLNLGSNKYMRLRSSLLCTWYQLKGEYEKIIDTLKYTINFFDTNDSYLSFVARLNLHHNISTFLIASKQFSEADYFLTKCITLPTVGSYTYHKILFQKAILGIHSDKPMIALDCWNRATQFNSHNNDKMNELWNLIYAYLEVYNLLNLIKLPKPFKLGRFQNSINTIENEKQTTNVAVTIAILLIYLIKGDRIGYMQKAEGISKYCHTHLRGKDHQRSRSILYMLKKVEEADYYKIRTELRVGTWKKKLRENPMIMTNSNEIMPYEKVWEIVLSQLK